MPQDCGKAGEARKQALLKLNATVVDLSITILET